MKKTIIVAMMVISLVLISSASAVWWNPFTWFGNDNGIKSIKYADMINNSQEKTLGNGKVISKYNDILIIANREYKTAWFPDNHPLANYSNLTIEFQVENLITGENYSILGSALIPKGYGGEFDINLTKDSLTNLPFNFTWAYSDVYTYVVQNYTDEETNISILIKEKNYADYSKDIKNIRQSIKDGFLDPTVSACGTLSTAGMYTLTQNIVGTGTCITIGAENISLDCVGYNITYKTAGANSNYGVSDGGGYDNTTVKNCNIRAGAPNGTNGWGIYFSGVLNSLISNNTIITNGSSSNNGIRLEASSHKNIIFNNTINTSGTSTGSNGIILSASSSNNISFNTIFANGTSANMGIYFTSDASNNTIFNNVISTSGGTNSHGIYMITATTKGNNFTSNTFTTISGDDINIATAGIKDNWFIDQQIRSYTFTGAGGIINVRNSTVGQIQFFYGVTGVGSNLIGNSTSDIVIGNNSIKVSASNLNISANITLYNMDDWSFTNPVILRNGAICNQSTVSQCYNFTSLKVTTITFNVSNWSNYSIGEAPPPNCDQAPAGTGQGCQVYSPRNTCIDKDTGNHTLNSLDSCYAVADCINNLGISCDYYNGFSQVQGICANDGAGGGTCAGTMISSGEYGLGVSDGTNSSFFDGNENSSCSGSSELMTCSSTGGYNPSADGVCLDNSCMMSGTVGAFNCSDFVCSSTDINSATVQNGCASAGGWACDSSVNGTGWYQNGICADIGTCQTSGYICYDTGMYFMDSCSVSCTASSPCDSKLTDGNFESNYGYCSGSVCIPNLPAFTSNQTNVNSSFPINGSTVQLNLTIQDRLNISYYRLAVNDTLDGSYINLSLQQVISGNITAVFNYTIVNFSTSGGTLGWKVWANDTSGHINESVVYTLNVQSQVTDTCSCPASGDWTVTDNCIITTACNIGANTLYLNCPNYFEIQSDISLRRRIKISICRVIYNGGRFIYR